MKVNRKDMDSHLMREREKQVKNIFLKEEEIVEFDEIENKCGLRQVFTREEQERVCLLFRESL